MMQFPADEQESISLIQFLVDTLIQDNQVSEHLAMSRPGEQSAQCKYPGIQSIDDVFTADPSDFVAEIPLTTVMIRNLPRKCSQRMLLGDIIAAGFGELIDFLYLPTDISSAKNLGYAFANFVHADYALRFRDLFHKNHLPCMRGSRTGLSVSPAVIQGFDANLENVMKNASVHRIRNPEYLPLVLNRNTGKLGPCNMEMDIKRRHSHTSVSSFASTSASSSPKPSLFVRAPILDAGVGVLNAH